MDYLWLEYLENAMCRFFLSTNLLSIWRMSLLISALASVISKKLAHRVREELEKLYLSA